MSRGENTKSMNDLINMLSRASDAPLENLVYEINITSAEHQQAQCSFDYIKEVLKNKSEEGRIPTLTEDPFQVGAYIRGSKPKPLNDLDIFLPLTGRGTTINPNGSLIDQNGYIVSSVTVLNDIKTVLQETYPSEISRNQQAVSIELTSYGMTIDVVPAIPVNNSNHFIIPWGRGEAKWKKSNPRLDQEILMGLDLRHNWKVSNAIKIAKHWNGTKNRNRLRSYHVEAIAYHVFHNHPGNITTLLTACSYLFSNMQTYLYNCPDPTGLSEPIHQNLLPINLISQLSLYGSVNMARDAINQGSTVFINYLNN